MRLSDDELRSALRAEAAAHRPDREAMLDRITTAAMSPDEGTARRGPRIRMAAAAAAVVAVFAGGGVANWALAGGSDRDDPAPTPAPSPTTATASPSPAASASAPQRETPTAEPTTRRPTSKPAEPTATQPGNTRTELWSDGSVDPDGGASVVTLKAAEELTALEVVIRVARTDGLVARGGTKQTPGASVSATVTEEPDALVYRFVLSSADTLAPGTYTFTAKYTHPSETRNAGADTYQATATTASTPLKVHGDFH
ncbi:hypothetical protein [Actinoplanes aureus]|uniref:Uncharacterized protein n=1 Tax=Actinoplanes aureus TaxID=2792083 RepID=A0A931C6J3_9ACTN|nr:hypothetical protein [Actinoplanes aureus]MBG0560388.1 hypothetical protein [Actinoplanes aureus]